MSFEYDFHAEGVTDEERAAAFRDRRLGILRSWPFRYGTDYYKLLTAEGLAKLSGLSAWKLKQVLREKRGLSCTEFSAVIFWLRLVREAGNANKLCRVQEWAKEKLKDPLIIDEHARAVLEEVVKRTDVLCLPGDAWQYKS